VSLNPARACIQSDISLYRHKIVRDLLWSLCSPPLIAASPAGSPWVTDNWFDELIIELLEPLGDLDDDPSPLLSEINEDKDRRLGRIFETLMAYAFEISHRFDLLARNVVIKSKGRTSGEMDLLVHDKARDKTLHLEVAVKFYLAIVTSQNEPAWIGPNPDDRLSDKKKGMEKQLDQSHSTPAQQCLKEQGITIDDRLCIMKGRLFAPLSHEPDPKQPPWINPGHLKGWWSHIENFLDYQKTHDLDWVIVDKSDWLSPLTPNDAITPLSHDELRLMLSQEGLFDRVFSQPVCIAGLKNGYENERGFLVPDSWIQENHILEFNTH
jgi:uncharacterized protein